MSSVSESALRVFTPNAGLTDQKQSEIVSCDSCDRIYSPNATPPAEGVVIIGNDIDRAKERLKGRAKTIGMSGVDSIVAYSRIDRDFEKIQQIVGLMLNQGCSYKSIAKRVNELIATAENMNATVERRLGYTNQRQADSSAMASFSDKLSNLSFPSFDDDKAAGNIAKGVAVVAGGAALGAGTGAVLGTRPIQEKVNEMVERNAARQVTKAQDVYVRRMLDNGSAGGNLQVEKEILEDLHEIRRFRQAVEKVDPLINKQAKVVANADKVKQDAREAQLAALNRRNAAIAKHEEAKQRLNEPVQNRSKELARKGGKLGSIAGGGVLGGNLLFGSVMWY